jgi:hypothetical protein
VTHGLLSEASGTGTGKLNATLEQVRSAVPKSLQQLIERRTERLTAEERALLTVASVVGVEFTAYAVAAGAGRDAASVDECCDGLAHRHLLLQDAGLAELPDGSAVGLEPELLTILRFDFFGTAENGLRLLELGRRC